MTPKEQEIAIKELEERVDRLRNIYEQYFLGFERLEPTVPRKDVDRRFMLLRKEQIRNTALRFRFNVVTQKYNTYAMHWVRICRQIEEGTYKRHLRRAKARFGELSSAPEPELSIDIDIGDFDVDMDEVLAEADAAAEGCERSPADTLPPPPSGRAAGSARAVLATPGTSFAIAGRGAGRAELERQTPPPSMATPAAPERAARSAALPPGAKAKTVRRREEGEQAPPSVRLPPPSSSQFVGPGGIRAPVSSPRIAPAAPSSAGRQPTAPVTPGGPQIRPLGSGGRLPVAAPVSAPDPTRPAPPGVAGAAPSRPDPVYRPPLPPPSSPRLPLAPLSSPRLQAPPPRAPMPSYIAQDTDPGAPQARPPGTRPRAPLPLPSQSARPAKKE